MKAASELAERFPTLAHHIKVLRASWAMENEADKVRKPISDHEFLPAALEIMEKPPSPGLRWLMLSLCALFSIALAWSIFGRVDVVAVATGKVIPTANIKVIQAIEIGSVRAIHVRDGQRVHKGDLLIELDPTLAGADQAQATQGLLSARIGEARNNALRAYLDGAPPRFVAPPGIRPDIAQTQTQLIRSLIAEYEAQRASLIQSRAERCAELSGSEAEVAKLRDTLPLIERGLAARKELTDKGYFSKIQLLDYERQRVDVIHNIDVQASAAAKARAAIANIDAQLAALRATFGKTAMTDLAKSEDESAIRTQELSKSERRREFQQLRSPVDGTVQQLVVHTVGGVVQPAQALMVIVPGGSDVEVEAQILNKDIGFVRVGQKVRVKLEAFPFTTYGLIDGEVSSISRDAIDQGQQRRDAATAANREVSAEHSTGLVYSARIKLHQRTIRVANKDEPIGPGLAVQAEIKTGTRRIIEYLLSPIAKTLDEAGRER